MSMRYLTSICVEDPNDDNDDKDEIEVYVDAQLSSDGDGGLDVELTAWKMDDALPDDVVEQMGLADTVMEEAWSNAYCRGGVKPGIYKPYTDKEGKANMLEVLGICQVPGQFDWRVVARRLTIPFPGDDAFGLVLMHPHYFVLPPEPEDHHTGMLRPAYPEPDEPERTWVLVSHKAPPGQVLADCKRCSWHYARPWDNDSGETVHTCTSCGALAKPREA